jgi:putative oxidoreductase
MRSTLTIPGLSTQIAAWPLDLQFLRKWAPMPLRLIVGYGFIAHGYAKFSRGPATFAVVLDTIGVPIPHLLAWLTTLVELIGGFAVLIGAFVPLASLPMAAVLLTAMFTIHWPYGFFSVKLAEVTATGTKFGPVGYEIILLYLAALVALAIGGAGPLSVDRWLCRSSKKS